MTVDNQSATLAFLTDPANYGCQLSRISTNQTHISVIIFVGSRAFKLKRAVRLPYVDFSTADRRLAACYRELELNRRTAPMLYLAVRRITREANGSLMFDGPGELLDAVVEMVRFDEDTLFDKLAVLGQLTPTLMAELACTVAHFHSGAVIDHRRSGAANMAAVLAMNEKSLAGSGLFAPGTIASLTTRLWRAFDSHVALLDERGRAGKVRCCHGDLHLRNICLIEGVPTLFDCIEFNDEVATIDVLYDLAFLLMDLWHRGLEPSANLVFNRYTDECDETQGLILLPFFMSMRATIRAHIAAEQATQDTGLQRGERAREASDYAALALRLLAPVSPRLVAIGGLSGTGKSTVAAAIAAAIGPAPGARVLASDRIRKRLCGVAAQTRLPERAYRLEVSERVYAAMAQNVQTVLNGGHGVVVDGVFDRPAERDRIERVARDASVPFTGLWLYASPEQLLTRISERRGDPSDATVAVVRAQLARNAPAPNWIKIEASGTISTTVVRATEALSCQNPYSVASPNSHGS
ncbi:MAG: aminoglycoside phosphotransferase [Candidimonas sp.]|nr:MAG: aminoglycoside phosphotransferase [Candidimonas sp.]TAM23913.1 MAG: aminoglycoside phosphotransferase [Candidimonas sp.]